MHLLPRCGCTVAVCAAPSDPLHPDRPAAADRQVHRCEVSGMDGHIPKPLRMDALALLAAFMEPSGGEDEGEA